MGISGLNPLVYGDYGDEKVAQSAKIGNYPLGTRMMLPDGRVYAHAKASTAASIVVGAMCEGAATLGASAHIMSDMAAEAGAGSTVIGITLGATTAITVADQYEDGYIWANDAAGQGYIYKIASSNSGAVSTTVNFTLAGNDSIVVALGAGTAKVGLRRNEFRDTVIHPSQTGQSNAPAGITQTAVSAGFYHWLCRRGSTPVLSGAAPPLVGGGVVADTTVDGAVTLFTAAADTAVIEDRQWGYCMTPGTGAGDHDLVYLTLE